MGRRGKRRHRRNDPRPRTAAVAAATAPTKTRAPTPAPPSSAAVLRSTPAAMSGDEPSTAEGNPIVPEGLARVVVGNPKVVVVEPFAAVVVDDPVEPPAAVVVDCFGDVVVDLDGLVVVDVVAGPPVTRTTPCMPEWMLQWYGNVPALSKRWAKVSRGATLPELNDVLSSDVTV